MSTISKDGRYVHLWDLLTDVPVGETKLSERCERRREMGQRVKNKLNAGARIWGQEVSLSAKEDGWEVNLFTCFNESSRDVLTLFVPRDKSKPVTLLAPEDEVVVVKERAKWIR